MAKVPKRRIREIMTTIDCPQDFSCYKSGFDNLCQRVIVEYDNAPAHQGTLCSQEKGRLCKMRVSSQSNYCCRCPLRLYVATYLNNLAALEGDISESSSADTCGKN